MICTFISTIIFTSLDCKYIKLVMDISVINMDKYFTTEILFRVLILTLCPSELMDQEQSWTLPFVYTVEYKTTSIHT